MKSISNTSILVLVLIGIGIALAGLTKLKTNADYRVYFDSDDALLKLDSQLAEKYSSLDSLLLILSIEEGNLLEQDLVERYTVLEENLLSISQIKRVSGFFQFLENDEFFDTNIFSDGNEENLEVLLERLHKHPRAINLITTDGRYGLVDIGVSLPGINAAKEVKELIGNVEAVVNKQLLIYRPQIKVNYSGTLALNEAYIDVVRHDLKRFVPCLFFIFFLCLFAFFRHWLLCALLIGTALMSALSAFGIAGWLGWELAAINAFTPIIIMSLNIATSMHVVVNYIRYVADGIPNTDAMVKSIQYNFNALTLSKLTTALGFLLLTFSPSPPVQIVGYIVAVGMVFSYFLCLTVLRIFLPKLKLSTEHAKDIVNNFSLGNLGEWTISNSKKIIIFSISLIIIGLVSLQQLEVNDNVYEYFPEEHRFRQGTQLIDTHFNGSIRLFYSIEADKPFGVLEADFRNKITNFTKWLRQKKEIARVDDVFTQANKRGVNYKTVRSFLEINSPSMLSLEQELTENYDATKISVILKTVSAKEVISIDQEIKKWLDNNMSPYIHKGGVGPDLLFARLGERNAKSMFISLALALILIALMTGILMRSFSAVFIGLVCNFFPVIIVFSIWAIFGGFISLGSAMVMGMIMGIIVDDTLHMLLKFPKSTGVANTNSILLLFEKVGPAIVITSITLAAGLIVGIFSGFRPIYELSLLSLSIILMAMLADLLLLPALMKSVNFQRT